MVSVLTPAAALTKDMTVTTEENKVEVRKDIVGRELAIGDVVAFNPPKYKGIILGKVVKFTTKGIRVQFKRGHHELTDTAISSNDVIKVDSPEAIMYILKKGGLSN